MEETDQIPKNLPGMLKHLVAPEKACQTTKNSEPATKN